ncbi:MAG: methionyl-tRNA formyltransferase [SAR202 cluster bacterium]|jgi:methionyl-tRNA formyltransferase|nr:methionyl-tRNA formyltransferase [Dehalococcoidia bacterium]MQG55200.1 methionyl-tRNA formyltransferase [SAR202 cluster bacterium]|tara:strand:+ start:246 stop:1202 length:957 start_codon:yes stop_codon:yes gene_type:complete
MRLVFMGTPTFAVPVLAGLTDLDGSEVVAVYTPPDRPAGRGRKAQSSPVKDFAVEHGLEIKQPANFRSAEVQAELAALQPDAIIIAAYGKLLPKPVLYVAPLGCLNIHPSLLPRHRGPSPVATTILNGDQVTGVTIMLLDEGMDTGPLIAQHEFFLKGSETTDELTTALFKLGGKLLEESLPQWQSGELLSEPQDESLVSVTRKLERADGLADWTLTADELERRARAFTPWPGLYTTWEGSGLKLVSVAYVASDSAGFEPGTVVGTDHPDLPAAVATSKGFLGLKVVQLEGKRAVDLKDFLNGSPDFIGAQLSGPAHT